MVPEKRPPSESVPIAGSILASVTCYKDRVGKGSQSAARTFVTSLDPPKRENRAVEEEIVAILAIMAWSYCEVGVGRAPGRDARPGASGKRCAERQPCRAPDCGDGKTLECHGWNQSTGKEHGLNRGGSNRPPSRIPLSAPWHPRLRRIRDSGQQYSLQ